VSELVLLTGASSGIGLSAAVACAAAGHRVVATMRNIERRGSLDEAAAAHHVSVDVEQLDVTSDSVPAKIRELILKYGPFFAVVNNAAIALGGAFEEQSEEDIRAQFETNVFGLMAVTRAVLPSMRAAQRGRIINVSSLSGRIAFPLLSAYAATKHAVEGFSEALRWEVEPFGIDVCLVEPDNFKTPIHFEKRRHGRNISTEGSSNAGHAGRGSAPAGLYTELRKTVERLSLEEADRAPHPDVVGKVIAELIIAGSPKFRSVIGMDARTLVTLRRMVPDRLFASGIRRLMHLPRSR
jgi:NAD(P)-dependent dehydrogenase (short-subunit alcohol dehydrogenase family)